MHYNPYSLKNKQILVTGASSGIGRATAVECSKLGARVIITARNEERLHETLSMLCGYGHEAIVCDLHDDESVSALVERLPEIHGIVNNAGINKLQPINFLKQEDFKKIMTVNTLGPIFLMQKALKKKKLRSEASVVFTSSISALGYTAIGEAMYVTSKGAISSFVKEAAKELAKKKIRVNAVCPGMVKTAMSDSYDLNNEDNDDMSNYPLGRYADPIEIAWAIIYLLSDASKWVTGTNLVIDGGLTT